MRPWQAQVRFGLGRRPADPLPSDPNAWLLGQLEGPDPLAGTGPSSAEGLTALRTDRKNKPAPGESQTRPIFVAGTQAQLAAALTTDTPFRERLVWFWTNHFTVSVRRPVCAAVIPAFVSEAIRPHVTARFAEMLHAVMRHPAMLLYLDNASSTGPDSPAGQRTHRGLNENLARECLELHTLSPAAGYTQADVTAFAAILTGWSLDLQADPPGFRFRPFAHQPGEQVLLGRRFPPGEAGGMAALDFLATHPATYRFLATRLVRHFGADDPPPVDIARIEAVLTATQGDLQAAAGVLVEIDSAWQPGTKLRSPQELLIAGSRALDLPPGRAGNLAGALAGMGQPLWAAPAPNGWPDQASDWAGPEAMVRRLDWAYGLAGGAGPAEPADIARAALGPLLQPATLNAIRHAGSRRDGLTLLLTSPEFQRR
jgi:uncharacterized protein (DUF1800 family)